MLKIHFPTKLFTCLLCLTIGLGSCREKVANGFPGTITEGASPISAAVHSEYDHSVSGKVTHLADGDSFTMILDNGSKTKVRLFAIDAPERRQAFSNVSKNSLADLVLDKNIVVFYDEKDVFDRILGVAYIGDMNVNQEQVRRGMAWHFKRYSNDRVLAGLEKEARAERRGLWEDQDPLAPWEYRKYRD